MARPTISSERAEAVDVGGVPERDAELDGLFGRTAAAASSSSAHSLYPRDVSPKLMQPSAIRLTCRSELPRCGVLHVLCSFGFEQVLCDDDRSHRRWPACVEGEVCDGLDQFVLGETIVDRPTKVTGELLGAVERDESGDGDQAAGRAWTGRGVPRRRRTTRRRSARRAWARSRRSSAVLGWVCQAWRVVLPIDSTSSAASGVELQLASSARASCEGEPGSAV